MTKLPMSTISFNTLLYLKMRCERLVSDGLIQSYMYIRHYAEKDTTKDHIHLLLVPSRPVDPIKIRKLFVEPCEGSPDLGCLPFQPSKLGDWLLYAIHHPAYLMRKGLTRVNTYHLKDIHTNESYDYLEQIYNDSNEQLQDNRIELFLDKMRRGYSFGAILALGIVPPNQIIFYDKLYRNNLDKLGECIDYTGNEIIPLF